MPGSVEQGPRAYRREHAQSAVEGQIRFLENISEDFVAKIVGPTGLRADSLGGVIRDLDASTRHRSTVLVIVGFIPLRAPDLMPPREGLTAATLQCLITLSPRYAPVTAASRTF